MCLYLENPMESNENIIETIKEFSKVARYITMIFIKIKMLIRSNADLYKRSIS